jgi:hypothetical protein
MRVWSVHRQRQLGNKQPIIMSTIQLLSQNVEKILHIYEIWNNFPKAICGPTTETLTEDFENST